MRTYKAIFALIVFMALLAGPVSALAQNEPVNDCIMIPEVMKGRSTQRNTSPKYQPESCIASSGSENGLEQTGQVTAESGAADAGLSG
jgi:hypothetical protein